LQEQPQKTTTCHHTFHRKCLDHWTKEHNTCPLCRQSIPGRDPMRSFFASQLNLTGTVPLLSDFLQRQSAGEEPMTQIPMQIPLQFWFNRTPSLALPLASLPFAFDAEIPQPSGSVNYSRIDEARLSVSFGLHPEDNQPSGSTSTSRQYR
jgi:hypothetical protein